MRDAARFGTTWNPCSVVDCSSSIQSQFAYKRPCASIVAASSGLSIRRARAAQASTRDSIDSPYFDANLGIDKAAVVRRALQAGRTVAFAGDGFPDAAAARLVPASLRFARADLALALRQEGLPFVPFERWSEVARALLARGPQAAVDIP